MVLSLEQNKYIIKIYDIAKDDQGRPSSNIAVDLFEERYNFRISAGTIRNKWKQEGFQLQQQGGARSKEVRKRRPLIVGERVDPAIKYLRLSGKSIF